MIVLNIILIIISSLIALFLLYVGFLFVCWLFVNPKKLYDKNSKFYRKVLNDNTAFWLWFLRVKVHVSGLEKLPKNTKKIVFVSNHRSNYDPVVTWLALKNWQPAFISKQSNFKIPFFGRFIRKCCFMPINRTSPKEAIKTVNHASKLLNLGEVSIGVYPEGTRNKTKDKTLLPFHNGVFKIAQRGDASLAIVCVRGTENIHKRVIFRKTDVYVDVLDLLDADKIKNSSTEILGKYVQEKLTERLENKNLEKELEKTA